MDHFFNLKRKKAKKKKSTRNSSFGFRWRRWWLRWHLLDLFHTEKKGQKRQDQKQPWVTMGGASRLSELLKANTIFTGSPVNVGTLEAFCWCTLEASLFGKKKYYIYINKYLYLFIFFLAEFLPRPGRSGDKTVSAVFFSSRLNVKTPPSCNKTSTLCHLGTSHYNRNSIF